ncbi:3-hydroxybutyryl-CoA dehydrogenase [Alkalilimnicola sp. S0819]|uniref:3-hydroxybutyryl-CoA dehydrogenase n=1 Tax=Alkalilimnicola sp. S0819 TaxID=2613922 RepID=UPI001261E4CB|nr:3-hydroxybutyryl-CoA dehydrogenase [Alkalilimnicola sp. S0819]KAB7622803.1 3-hydroxybutyryl-CoA dehydrogenase [Alkalilimnicola sp. S0819]MPQ17299.1 3-hydroxybutyryl-CoA dehydrogenase [Alkalilimnicola sp. S0819]
MDLQRIGVLGAGIMGNGIAQAFAGAGLDVLMVDIDEAALTRGLAAIRKSLDRLVVKDKLSATDRDALLGRIRTATDTAALADRQLVVEAVSEDETLKGRIFQQLDDICPPEAILASNTSSISITRLAALTGRPEQVIGMHFMNPVPVMKLVEVIRGLQTSDETYRTVRAMAEGLGKAGIEVRDRPAFVLNRVLVPMINEAVCALDEGLASAEDIDTVMKLGANHPIGPLALADLIGLDTCLQIMKVLQRGFGDPKYRPSPLLQQMVDAGRLGRKSGRGFYDYQG